MRMNREEMMRSCRNGLSSLAGVDNRTMGEVAEMRMRSLDAAVQDTEEITDSLMGERAMASEDFSY